jgi:hypothetical protein
VDQVGERALDQLLALVTEHPAGRGALEDHLAVAVDDCDDIGRVLDQ